MLEDYAAFYLQKYLGKYVKGVSKEALKISAWKGDVELKNMQLKPEALLELKLPVKVKAGFLGSVKLKVPWSRLGQEPVIVALDRIFVLAEPSFKVEGANDDAVQEARYQYIKDAETAFVNSLHEQMQQQPEMNNSWMGSLIGTIISNIKLSVTNIHIRYEDTESNLEQPFALGVTLEKLAAVTVDENGKEIFVSGGGLDKINKSGELKKLAVYFDTKSKPWDLDWQNLSPADWSKAFEPGIRMDVKGMGEHKQHTFLLQPVDGMARYNKLGSREERGSDKPAQTATVTLEDVTLSLSEPQYRDALKLFDNISSFNMRVQHAHHRPPITIKENSRAWWQYAFKATIENLRKTSGHLSWEEVMRHARLRKYYVSLYAKLLVASPDRVSINDNEELRKLERELDKDVIVQWRNLAHTLADQAKSHTAEKEKEQQSKKSWKRWFGWSGQSDGDGEPRGLSDEEWQQLNQAIGYDEQKPSSVLPGQDPSNMLHTVLKIQMHHNATKLISDAAEELLTLSCDGLHSNIKIYSEAKEFDLKLESYMIRCPEGLLGESANHLDALSAEFSYLPADEELDWSLSAEASPLYITYYKSSVDRVITFFSSKTDVSREVALQTAAAFQVTLDEVARKTQQQFNEALKNKPRFSLLLDIAAPKITIPTNFYPRKDQQTKVMLDLGHFKMKTEKGEEQRVSQEESDLYMCFKMQLNDVSGFLVDGDYNWDEVHTGKKDSYVSPIIEKCAIFAAVQQICVPHPLYPSTRVAVRLPSVAIHFSPARYHRLMQLVNVLQSNPTDNGVRSWEPADFEGDIYVLSWKGMGNREAVWSPRYGALAGPFFYILESTDAESYEHCVNLIGKQVYMVPPESVGGVEHVLAICDPKQFRKKIVESVSALILRFKDEERLNNWRVHLTAVIRKINAVAKGSSNKSSDDPNQSSSMAERENFFLTGALDELKICVASNKSGDTSREQVLLEDETALLELRAVGSKVEFVMREHDMAVGAALLSLEIEDKWYGDTSPSCRFLARSTFNDETPDSRKLGDSQKDARQESSMSEKDSSKKPRIDREDSTNERFFDSADEFELEQENNNKGSRRGISRRSSSSMKFYDADASFQQGNNNNKDQPSIFARTPDLLPNFEDEKGLSAGQDEGLKSFIKAQVLMSSPEAPHYVNIDKQVKISLATLAFYLNRPTVVTLLDFVNAINADMEEKEEGEDTQEENTGDEAHDVVSVVRPAEVHEPKGSLPVFDRKDSIVKGLLGTGKTRIVFLLVLDMDRAQVVLNRDDGAQLATLSQDDLHCSVKIFPASYAIVAALGNLRITDDSLPHDHPYYWLCDMRDPAGKSFIELGFVSFNEDDDDYDGYEFSLSGQLSEIRLVYLHRFIQEITSYVMGLVPADAEYVVKLKDKVGDAEKTFTQSEVEGAPAMRLSLSLSKPIIIFPKDTNSKNFLELDILHISVRNTFQWLGGRKEDIEGIRLETISLKVEDIHLVACVNGSFGENVIKDSSGILVSVRRTLRDLRHRLPAIDAAVEVQLLKAAMSDKEYQVMIDCCLSNISETPKLSPPVKKNENKGTPHKDKEARTDSRPSSPRSPPHDDSPEDEVYTTLKLTVDVSLIELAVFVGRTEYTPLASIQVCGVWAAFKMSTNQEQYIMASLDTLSVTDDREGIEPELKFMVGKVDTTVKEVASDTSEENDESSDSTGLVMLVLDAKLSPGSQLITLRIQRPRVLLALDFLLAVAEFFIPSVADMLPTTKSSDELPPDMKNWMFLRKTPYFQDSEEVVLSPKHVLVADDERINFYIYDGGGGRILLTDASGNPAGENIQGPLIVVGHGKTLQFRNVVIENAGSLDRCVILGSNSSYSVSEHDGVYLEDNNEPYSPTEEAPKEKNDEGPSQEIIFDLQAIGPELVMHTSSSYSSEIKDRLLRAKLDVFSRLVMKGDDLEVTAKISSLSLQGRRGHYVLEPVDTSCRYSRVSGKQNVHATMSDVVCNLTFSTLQLILKLQEDAQSLLLLTSKKLSVECTEFDRIWADEERSGSSQIAFWRPRAPPGFAILGHCLTVVDEPPSKGVIALNMNLVQLKKPVDFRLIWSANRNGVKVSVWLPVAPEGYVVVGCVTTVGDTSPTATSVMCVLLQLVTEWYMRDCISVKDEEDWAFWRADNSMGTFFPILALRPPHNSTVYELRHVAFKLEKTEEKLSLDVQGNNDQPAGEENGLMLTTVTRFKLVWWDKGGKSTKPVSVWRPVTLPGCVLVGDLAVEGYEPPSVAYLPQDKHDSLVLQKPLKFVKMGVIHEHKGVKPVSFWFPIAPPGYVALGCLAVRGYSLDKEAADRVRCVRNDLVLESQFPASSLWNGRQVKRINEDISIWPLQVMDNESKAASFVTNITQDAPPKQLAFQLKDLGSGNHADNLIGDGEVRRLTATVFDDFGGMMAPLVNVSLTGITASIHGTDDAMKSTVNFSLVATTYNGRCDAWEPMIEPVEGYVRYTKESSALRSTESQVSLAATSDLNINASTANLNLMLDAYTSWNKLTSIELTVEERGRTDSGRQILQNEQEKKLHIVCHNDLGHQLYCRVLDENTNIRVIRVESGNSETFKVPSMMSLQDPFTNKVVKKKSVKFMLIEICNAQLPKEDGFGGRQYMVALRLLPQLQTAEQHQLSYQSARTRCVNPSEQTESGDVIVHWRESFIFEIEHVRPYNIEILITDLAKGSPAGYSCISSLGEDSYEGSLLTFEVDLYAGISDQINDRNPIGKLQLNYRFFSVGKDIEKEKLHEVQRVGLDPGTIQVGPSSQGPWTKLCLTLASTSSYIKIGEDSAASVLRVHDGVKHLTIRSLVTLKNHTAVTLDVSLFPHYPSTSTSEDLNTLAEEVFENERYQPVAGWGSSWPGHLLPLDPGRWSKSDMSWFSQDFPNVELPLGWEWSSDWYVDTQDTLDPDGWVYGFSFRGLTNFPPETCTRKLSFVRRRRWIRTRQRTMSVESTRCVLGTLKPGESIAMPVTCFREARQEYFLQLRPQVGDAYGWTQAVLCHTHGQKKLPTQEINIRELLSEHILSSCLLEAAASSSNSGRNMWFSLDVNFIDIGKDVYVGAVQDCELVLTAPLKIMNHLPVAAEYAIFDSSRVRGYRMQDRGTVQSGETAEVYMADVRKALYLSFIPEGSWHPAKDMVLISHPLWEVAKYMILENQSTKRKVKVHIEYDCEEEATGKALRISVPFWIDCSRCPSLRLKVVELEHDSKGCLPSTYHEKVLNDISFDELRNPYTMISPFAPKTSGICASLSSGEVFGAVSSLADLDKPDGTVELVASDGKCYFRLLISTSLCPLRFAHTKVITVRPYVTFTNRFGQPLLLKQSSQDDPYTLNTSDWRASFPVATFSETSTLQVRMESSQWSYPVEIKQEETMHMYLQDEKRRKHFIRIEIRGYQEGSKFVVVFSRGSFRGPYRLENRTKKRKIRFRQLGTPDEDWESLYPNSTKAFAWRDPCGQRIIELLSDGMPPEKSFKYELDKLGETCIGEFFIQVKQLDGLKLLRLTDGNSEQQQLLEEDRKDLSTVNTRALEKVNQFKLVLDIGKFGLSVIDQRPQEIFYLYLENLKFSILTSSQENSSRYKLRVRYLQLDDQNVLSTSSVILAPDSGDESVLKSTITMLNDKEEGTQVYPYVALWVTKKPWRVNIHEPVIWTALGMYNNLQLDALSSDSEVVEADPEIRTNLVDISEARFKITLQTEPGLRPRGVLGIWSPLVSLAGNTTKMPIHISGATLENRYMRQSEVSGALINHIRKDVVHQAFQLLFGVNVFGMASSTLETLSKSAADLSRDEKFKQFRLKQDRLKHVSGVGDGLLRGGEALARGFAFGLSGVVTKPCNNARENGFFGFFQGIGKAFTGIVFQPISGVLDFIALTVDGVNISYTKCFEAFSHDQIPTRMRLPRAIHGDGVLLPYDERAALGQAMLQLAEDHNYGQNVVFKESAKFALTDFYEDHFEVPGNRVVMITNRRVMLLSEPSSYKSIGNVTPSNPCKILWEVPYMELLALETAKGQGSSFVIVHLRSNPKTFAQVIKCLAESVEGGSTTTNATQLFNSIRRRWRKYGPDRQTLMSQMRKWQQSRSLPTPRASKRVLVSDEERSKRDFDRSQDYSSSSEESRRRDGFMKEVLLFEQIWKSEQDSSVCCASFSSMDVGAACTIWRPVVPEGYVSIGDVAYSGKNPPTVTVAYKNEDGLFSPPIAFDLVWRNWKDGYEPITIWKPIAREGYEALGYVAVAAYMEPELNSVWCARQDIVQSAGFEQQPLWHVKHPWHCYVYQVQNDALTFFVSREQKKTSHTAKKISI